jgi:DNA-directed RNA polymerase subunit H (RpoH/RPB5)
MEFENIHKSRNIILEMLENRNCDISNYKGQTKDEINIQYQKHVGKANGELDTLDIIVDRNGEEDAEDIQLKKYKIMVKYLTTNKVRNQNIINCIDEIYEQEIISNQDTLIIITKDKITYQGALEEHINRLFYRDGIFVQILCLDSLLFNISQHELVPNYRILTNIEKKELIDKLYLEDENRLPFVLVTDPLAKFYGMRIGQAVEIEYNNETNGKNKFYRLCVAN